MEMTPNKESLLIGNSPFERSVKGLDLTFEQFVLIPPSPKSMVQCYFYLIVRFRQQQNQSPAMKDNKTERRSASLALARRQNSFRLSANRVTRPSDSSSETKRSRNNSQDQLVRHRNSFKTGTEKDLGERCELATVREIEGLDPRLRVFASPLSNNHELIRRVLERRKIWVENNDLPLVHLRWSQTTQLMKFHTMEKSTLCFNHFEYHREISNKQCLIKNLTKFCEANKLNAFDITPTTFIIDFYDDQHELNLNSFVKFFNHHLPKGKSTIDKLSVTLPKSFNQSYNRHEKRSQGNFYTRPTIHPTFFSADSHYVWLLKPTFLNRGRGIHIFTSLTEFEKLINQYVVGHIEQPMRKEEPSEREISEPMSSSQLYPDLTGSILKDSKDTRETKQLKESKMQLSGTDEKKTPPCTIKALAFVVQKYIEKPLLINNRKFDIRVWALVTHTQQLYFFKEGYIRTSCEEYTLGNLDNMYIHLTNNAIQKHSDKYEKYEFGNQLSFHQMDEVLERQGEGRFSDRMIKKIKEIIWISMCSVKRKLNFRERKSCFEIFGFDFFVDSRMKVWLIEVNTNPCLEESSPLLGQLIPRMVDDAFKLTVDKLYTHKECVSGPPVTGYEDEENMWELLGDFSDANRNSLNKRFTFVRR